MLARGAQHTAVEGGGVSMWCTVHSCRAVHSHAVSHLGSSPNWLHCEIRVRPLQMILVVLLQVRRCLERHAEFLHRRICVLTSTLSIPRGCKLIPVSPHTQLSSTGTTRAKKQLDRSIIIQSDGSTNEQVGCPCTHQLIKEKPLASLPTSSALKLL